MKSSHTLQLELRSSIEICIQTMEVVTTNSKNSFFYVCVDLTDKFLDGINHLEFDALQEVYLLCLLK